MDTSICKAWAETNLAELKDMMGLGEWTVTVHFGPNEDGETGICNTSIKYLEAHITLDPAKLTDQETFERILEHELLHIHHAAFDMAWDAVMPLLGKDSDKTDSFEAVWSYSMEMTVKSLERMLRSMREKINESHSTGTRKRKPGQRG